MALSGETIWQPAVWAQQYGEKDRAELAKGLKAATLSLEEGLTASEREGKPISGKFEVEEGKFQLAVYTMKGGQVRGGHRGPQGGEGGEGGAHHGWGGSDRRQGAGRGHGQGEDEAISPRRGGRRRQSERGLPGGERAPRAEDGHPVATVTVAKGDEFKTVSEKLD